MTISEEMKARVIHSPLPLGRYGYHFTGEYRKPNVNEYFLNQNEVKRLIGDINYRVTDEINIMQCRPSTLMDPEFGPDRFIIKAVPL